MAKTKTIHIYLLCVFICSGLFSQDAISQIGNSNDEQYTRKCVKELYNSQIGVREIGGSNKGPHVEMYLKSVGLAPGHAYCAAFVSWVYQNADVQTPLSGWVPSYALKSKRIYHRGKEEYKTPQCGDVFMIWYSKLNRPAHMGFVDQWGKQWVTTVEANTNTNGSRDGDGVYRKRRLKKQVWAVSDFIGSAN